MKVYESSDFQHNPATPALMHVPASASGTHKSEFVISSLKEAAALDKSLLDVHGHYHMQVFKVPVCQGHCESLLHSLCRDQFASLSAKYDLCGSSFTCIS